MTQPVLLTVSGVIPADIQERIERGERPRADYRVLAEAFQADLIDFNQARQAAGWLGRLLERLGGPALVLAWACFLLRKKYAVIFTDGEQVGIPLALLLKFLAPLRRPRHLMIVHILSVRKKTLLIDLFGLQTHIDRFLVYSTFQKQFIESRWQVPAERVIWTPFMVDEQFFAPDRAAPGSMARFTESGRPVICAVGLEFRDYPTLLEAVDGLDVTVVIAAASPWSKRADTTQGRAIPTNVVVERFSQYDLRALYAVSRLVVMPLYPVEFQAGVTAILEGMAMGKPVICTRTPGQTDVIVDGENGLYVPPGNPAALRKAICDLLADPEKAQRLGRAGRQKVESALSLDRYADRLKQIVLETHLAR